MARTSASLSRTAGDRGFFAGWGGLARFWLIVLLVAGMAGGIAQILGPPRHADTASNGPATSAPVTAAALPPAAGEHPSPQVKSAAPPAVVVEQRGMPLPTRPGRDQPGPIADPDPALLEPAAEDSKDLLPRISADGRSPMQVYAAGFDRSSRRPRIGILVAGIGLSEAQSMNAAQALPPVSLAVSPYGGAVPRVLVAARALQHEYLLSIPMEPQGFPLNDPGDHALMTSLGRPDNMKRLQWIMSRFPGYVGVTGALGDLRGERFAGLSEQMEPVLRQVAQRGLLYVDPRPGQSAQPIVWSRGVDVVIDDSPSAEIIDRHLIELEAIARERGSALGLAGAPRPMTVDHIASWASGLVEKGLILAPVSALVQQPRDVSSTQTPDTGRMATVTKSSTH